MFKVLWNLKKLSDVKHSLKLQELKNQMRIAIIDDEDFKKSQSLKSHAFNIDEIGDIKTLTEVEVYDIIVCDIHGVGKSFGSRQGGAHVLSEIRKLYPDKYLISYSGAQYDITFNESLSKADSSIAKDAATEDWVEQLETAIKSVGDPKNRWLRFRQRLIESHDVSAYEVCLLEQAFIKSVIYKNQKFMERCQIQDSISDLVKVFIKTALPNILLAVTRGG